MITKKTVLELDSIAGALARIAEHVHPSYGKELIRLGDRAACVANELDAEIELTEPAAQPFYKILAVDFDGCLCDSHWPDTGDPIQEVVDAVKRRQDEGWKTILWTCRSGEALEKAVRWCEDQGLVFDAVNDNIQEMKDLYGNDTRKVSATEYWDDRAVHVGISHEGEPR